MDLFQRPVIDSFSGEYEFLSNFYRREFVWREYIWPTSEHAYQAMKCRDPKDLGQFLQPGLTPGQVKRLGRRVAIRSDWEQIKDQVMESIVIAKFADPVMGQKLLSTGDAVLIEGNHWGDTYWGQCGGVGLNRLGGVLEHVRDLLQKQIPLEEI